MSCNICNVCQVSGHTGVENGGLTLGQHYTENPFKLFFTSRNLRLAAIAVQVNSPKLPPSLTHPGKHLGSPFLSRKSKLTSQILTSGWKWTRVSSTDSYPHPNIGQMPSIILMWHPRSDISDQTSNERNSYTSVVKMCIHTDIVVGFVDEKWFQILHLKPCALPVLLSLRNMYVHCNCLECKRIYFLNFRNVLFVLIYLLGWGWGKGKG